jgi:hypothetical protein
MILFSFLSVIGSELTMNERELSVNEGISTTDEIVTKTTTTSTVTTTTNLKASISTSKTRTDSGLISGKAVLRKVVSTNVNSEPSSYQIQEYKKSLNITDSVSAKPVVVKELMRRRILSRTNYRKITAISRIVEKAEEKEILAEELLDMNQEFVNRFGENIENKPEVREQVRNYVQSVKLKGILRIKVKQNIIEKLFENQITMEDLIDQIWNEI